MSLDYHTVLKEMKESVGTRDPVEYFDRLTDCLTLLFEKVEKSSEDNYKLKMHQALAIKWDPFLARQILANEISELRTNKEVFFNEITALKKAYSEDVVTQSYEAFCSFWNDTLGWHPFIGA